MDSIQTASVVVSDYSLTGKTLTATNLAQNPGFETPGDSYTYTNYAKYPSAASGTTAGWVAANGDLRVGGPWGGPVWFTPVTGLTGVAISTRINPVSGGGNTGEFLPEPIYGAASTVSLTVFTDTPRVSMFLRVRQALPNGTSGSIIAQTNWTPINDASQVSVNYPGGYIIIEVGTNASKTGIIGINNVLVCPAADPSTYFDGSSLDAVWTGAPYASTSVRSWTTPKNVVDSGFARQIWTREWQSHGTHSLKIASLGNVASSAIVAGAAASLTGCGVTFIPGQTYTVTGKLHLPAPQGSYDPTGARRINVTYNGTGGTTVRSTQAANVAGTSDHTVTFTVPGDATNCRIELANGGDDTTPVYWDDLLIVNAATAPNWFSGSLFPPEGQTVAWTGTPEDSTSTLTTLGPRSKLADVSNLSVDYMGTNSVYGDDESLPLGVASFTTDASFKNQMGRTIYVGRNADTLRNALVRDVSESTGTWSVSADMGETNRNYDYAFSPVVVNNPGVVFFTTGGTVFPPIDNTSGVLPQGTYPGATGNGLSTLAQLAQANGAFAYDNGGWGSLGLYPAPNTVTYNPNNSDFTPALSRAEPARYIEVNWYEGGFGTNIEVVPTDAPVIQVGAGETVVTDIAVNGWLQSVNQPTCVSWVEPGSDYYAGSNGVYAVAGNDNIPITPAQWAAGGGSLTVEPAEEDASILRVTVTGMTLTPELAPFRIAMTSGNFYQALRVTGAAYKSVQYTLKLPTGVDEKLTKTEVGVTVDNPFITSLEKAYHVGTRVARKYTGLVMSLSGSGEGYAPLQLLEHDYMRFLVRDVSGDETDTLSFEAEEFTRMSDFEEKWTGQGYKMSDFENVWTNQGYTMGQFMLSELRNPLKAGTGMFLDEYNGTWWGNPDGVFDNGDGTWTSSYPVDNGNGTWTG